MTQITSIEALEEIYGEVNANSLKKVAREVTPEYAAWINAARFCVLSTVGPEGTDGSPRGDDGPAVKILDPKTVAMPDWRGNNRADSLRNIVRDGRVSLMFMVPGRNNVIRLNGHASLHTDEELKAHFLSNGRLPRSVILIRVGEIYSQCARALMRSALWNGSHEAPLPSMGDILRAQTSGEVDGERYDREWSARAEKTMW